MTKIKICGITNIKDATLCTWLGVDFVGFVLSQSPRRISYEELDAIAGEIGSAVATVGVFAVEEDLRNYSESGCAGLDYYQVYFDPMQDVRQPKKGWIRAHWMHLNSEIPTIHSRQKLLLDFKHSGIERRRDELVKHRGAVGNAVILAGNLNADTVGETVREIEPWGVDVARGVEQSPGRKDHNLLRRFVENVRKAG